MPRNRRPRATPGQGRAAGARGARPGRHAAKGARGPAAPVTRSPAARGPRGPSRARRRFPPDPARVAPLLAELERLYPEATTALSFENPLQLLIATILSAQCTDERVNRVTPALFRRYPDAAAFASARREELEEMIRPTGFFRNKARAIVACCRDILEKHGGRVPATLEQLTALHGVGRKTANVVLGNAFAVPGLVVDTHVARLSRRLGLADATDPVRIEFALMDVVPRPAWTRFSHWLILHGRRICVARKPRCSACTLAPHCPRLGVVASQ
jgi:endonuclease-3